METRGSDDGTTGPRGPFARVGREGGEGGIVLCGSDAVAPQQAAACACTLSALPSSCQARSPRSREWQQRESRSLKKKEACRIASGRREMLQPGIDPACIVHAYVPRVRSVVTSPSFPLRSRDPDGVRPEGAYTLPPGSISSAAPLSGTCISVLVPGCTGIKASINRFFLLPDECGEKKRTFEPRLLGPDHETRGFRQDPSDRQLNRGLNTERGKHRLATTINKQDPHARKEANMEEKMYLARLRKTVSFLWYGFEVGTDRCKRHRCKCSERGRSSILCS